MTSKILTLAVLQFSWNYFYLLVTSWREDQFVRVRTLKLIHYTIIIGGCLTSSQMRPLIYLRAWWYFVLLLRFFSFYPFLSSVRPHLCIIFNACSFNGLQMWHRGHWRQDCRGNGSQSCKLYYIILLYCKVYCIIIILYYIRLNY